MIDEFDYDPNDEGIQQNYTGRMIDPTPPPLRPDPYLIANAEGDERARKRTVASIEELIERSSLGTPEAKRMREQTPPEVVERIVARTNGLRARRSVGRQEELAALIAEALTAHGEKFVVEVARVAAAAVYPQLRNAAAWAVENAQTADRYREALADIGNAAGGALSDVEQGYLDPQWVFDRVGEVLGD